MATEEELPQQSFPPMYIPKYADCGACGGEIEHMGKVRGVSLTYRHLCCPCDARCTNAKGPSCDCKCGGENHGTNLVVEVEKVVGGIPKITPVSYLASREVAREYREAINPLIERRDYLRSFKWLETPLYQERMKLEVVICKAQALRTHAARMKHLRAAAPATV
jgi:hypothetical protein